MAVELSPEQAMAKIQAIARSGKVRYSPKHFRKMCIERGIDMQDVTRVITNGRVQQDRLPEYDDHWGTYKYRVWRHCDGKNICVVVGLSGEEDEDVIHLVTVWEDES